MMSGGSPASNPVVSWSLTLSQLPWTYSTRTSGLASFHSSTSRLLASTDCFCQARLRNRRVASPPSSAPEPHAVSSSVPDSAAAGRVSVVRRMGGSSCGRSRRAAGWGVCAAGSPLHRAGDRAALEAALDEGEEQQAGQGRQDRGGGQRAEP